MALRRGVARKRTWLLEHEAEDDPDDHEARKRVGNDRDPDTSEPLRGVGRSEGAVEQGGRHAPWLVQVEHGVEDTVGCPISASEGSAHSRQEEPAEEELLS